MRLVVWHRFVVQTLDTKRVSADQTLVEVQKLVFTRSKGVPIMCTYVTSRSRSGGPDGD